MARALKVKRDDTVRVVTGKDKGKTGRVLRVEPRRQRVYVEGLNMRKRHQRANPIPGSQRGGQTGGVIESEGPIHVSNVMVLDPSTNEPTRVGVRRESGRRVRVARRSGEAID
jgi:large subunit ribosomal protein L24